LLAIARGAFALRTLGWVSYALIFAGGLLTALGADARVYGAGFLLVIGFDKMFNVYIRAGRQKIIPPQDYGKTTGVVVMLNNLSQPIAGLLVGVFAGFRETAGLILGLSIAMAALGVLALARKAHHSPP